MLYHQSLRCWVADMTSQQFHFEWWSLFFVFPNAQEYVFTKWNWTTVGPWLKACSGFNKENINNYLNRAYQLVAGVWVPTDFTIVHICAAHAVKAVGQAPNCLCEHKGMVEFSMFCLGSLLKNPAFDDAKSFPTTCMSHLNQTRKHLLLRTAYKSWPGVKEECLESKVALKVELVLMKKTSWQTTAGASISSLQLQQHLERFSLQIAEESAKACPVGLLLLSGH